MIPAAPCQPHAFSGGRVDVWPLPRVVVRNPAGRSFTIPLPRPADRTNDDMRVASIRLERCFIAHSEERDGVEVVVAHGWQIMGWNAEAGVLVLGDSRLVEAIR